MEIEARGDERGERQEARGERQGARDERPEARGDREEVRGEREEGSRRKTCLLGGLHADCGLCVGIRVRYV